MDLDTFLETLILIGLIYLWFSYKESNNIPSINHKKSTTTELSSQRSDAIIREKHVITPPVAMLHMERCSSSSDSDSDDEIFATH